MNRNVTTDTDFYKLSHWKAVHPDLDGLYSYGEPRKGGKSKLISWFGLQMIIMDHFLEEATEAMIKEGEALAKLGSGVDEMFNSEVWRKVAKLGYLPIVIKAVPEGLVIPEGNVMFTFEATEKWFAKTANSLESTLMHVWYPTSVATRAMNIKNSIKPFFDKSSDVGDFVLPVAVNDFGYRGAHCWESAGRGGAAFMVHFTGSDNNVAARALHHYYDYPDRLKSVWATEHGVALSFGLEHELDYVIHQLTAARPDQIVSIVTDTKNQDAFFKNVACHPDIIKLVKERTARTVWRPDTGVPINNVLKYSEILASSYGFSVNSKGFKVIGENTGLLQGDGIKEDTPAQVYKEYTQARWAADNVIFGSGGGLLVEGLSRDWSRWAIKPSYIEKAGVPENVQKIPASDMSKASKKGKLKLHRTSNKGYMTIESSKESPQGFNAYVDTMEVVLENGKFYPQKFTDILNRAK